MTELRIGAALLLVVLGGYIAVMNAGCLIFTARNKKRGINKHHSTVPLISLVIGWFAYLIYPVEPRIWIALVPVLDAGNWALAISLPRAIARGAFNKT